MSNGFFTTSPSTIVNYPLNGQIEFTIPFEFLARKFIVVTLIGTTKKILVLGNDYRFVATNKIQLSSQPDGSFTNIELRRVTSSTDRLVSFVDGSILRAYDLNIAQIQTIHIAEEARDLAGIAIVENDDGNLDARGRRIVNVANAKDAQDVVTFGMLREYDTSTGTNADRAATSAAEAKESELNASDSERRCVVAEAKAISSAGTAMTAAADANRSKVEAKASRDEASDILDDVKAASGPSVELVNKVEMVASSAAVYLDSYEHLVVNNDWTEALNTALLTGLPVIPNPNKTYNISGVVQSKGNKITGKMRINPTGAHMANLGEFVFDPDSGELFNSQLKLLYVFKVYDLIELLFIKSMGFNAILHAGVLYKDRPELTGDALKAAIKLALDNAQTANLKVNLTTGWEIASDWLAIDYVNTFSSHPAVFGFSVFDEPSFNEVSVERQAERLSALRALTDKNLNCVDSFVNFKLKDYTSYRSGYNPWADGYDIMFVDSYSHTSQGASLEENINKDLSEMRLDVGIAATYCSDAKIIPVCGLFKSTSFSTNFQQIKKTSSKLVRAAGGDFGVWAWDPIDPVVSSGVKSDTDLRGLASDFCELTISGKRIPKVYRIGGTSFNPSKYPPCAAKDGVRIVQKQDGVTTFVQSGTSCLGVLRKGADAEFAYPNLGGPVGGILFKGTYPVAITNIEMQRFMTIDFELLDVTGMQAGTMFFHYTMDEGTTISDPATSLPFAFSSQTPSLSRSLYFGNGEYWRGSKLAIQLAVNPPANSGYRLCFSGFIVTSDW